MSTVVVKCNCQHKFQDEEYGHSQRVANISQGNKEAICTVCGTTHRHNDFSIHSTFTK